MLLANPKLIITNKANTPETRLMTFIYEYSTILERRMPNNLEDLIYRFRWQIALLLAGVIVAAGGIFLTLNSNKADVEIISDTNETGSGDVVVEISGEVNKPGVYILKIGSRVNDVIIEAGGLTANADTNWIDKYLNRAAIAIDGQKIFIPSANEQSSPTSDSLKEGVNTVEGEVYGAAVSMVDINTATQEELEALSGIGPVYAKNIIENRPYSNADELINKKIIPQKTFEKLKDRLSVY